MAKRARLIKQEGEIPDKWPWHTPEWTSMSLHDVFSGDRRLEAETYLSGGYGIRLRMERFPDRWLPLGGFAEITQPSRLKGIQLGRDSGKPFLAATQVFDIRPKARKWLSLERTADAATRFVEPGTLLITCSGTVGRVTIASDSISGNLISHDLLRANAHDAQQQGWLYAYLRSRQARLMMTGSQYGHIIKHLEISHLAQIPIPIVDARIAAEFQASMNEIVELRNRAFLLRSEADEILTNSIGQPVENGHTFSVKASELFSSRRRFEANYYSPISRAILQLFSKNGRQIDKLGNLTENIWWRSRFKRYYGEAGIPYTSADELFTINPPERKNILVTDDDGHESYFVKAGWIIMACSGQIYGLNGSALLATKYHEESFFSHDLIRIIPIKSLIRSGYLLATLTHPELGRPLLLRIAYGTSIPHLDPKDVANFPVVRLSLDRESQIADMVEESADLHAKAEKKDRQLSESASRLVDQFLSMTP